jgi:uncharacterized protein (TIGR02246 family)
MVATGGVRQAIEERNREFVSAYSRGDTAGIAALYTEDAKVLPPGGETVTGRPGIQQFWQAVRDMGVQAVTLNTLDVESSGDLAYEVGSATLKIQPAGGQAATDTIKYVIVWKRQAGGPWQLAVDIWNSNTPG